MTLKKNKKKAFSLMEAIIAVVIIGLLVGVAVPLVGNTLEDSNRKKDEANAANLAKAADRLRLDSLANGITTGSFVGEDSFVVYQLYQNYGLIFTPREMSASDFQNLQYSSNSWSVID